MAGTTRGARMEHEILLAALRCAVADRSAIYVSTPLTTGKRWADWSELLGGSLRRRDSEYARLVREEVVEPNRENARRFVEQLRGQTVRPVVDPSALPDIPGWTQTDYRSFWSGVIEKLAETVVFLDGWQYSQGCAHEYLVAARTGLETLTQGMSPLGVPAALALLRQAAQEFEERQMPPHFLAGIIADMSALADQSSGETDGR